MIKTKIATAMNDIANLHKEIAGKYVGLSALLGQVADESSVPNASTTATTLVDASITPVAVSPTVIVTPMASAAAEVDSEGTPWDERIHSGAKTQVKSLLVTGGKAWRMKKGKDITPEFVEQVKAEIKGAPVVAAPVVAAPVVAAPVVAAPVVAAPVVAAPVVAAPVVAAPVVAAPVVPDNTAIRVEAIKVINRIVTDYGVTYDDVIAILVDEFKVPDFEGLVDAQYKPVLDRMIKFEADYKAVNDMITQIRAWGGETYQADVEAGLLTFFKAVNAESLGGVFHSDLPTITETIRGYYQSWEASPAKTV